MSATGIASNSFSSCSADRKRIPDPVHGQSSSFPAQGNHVKPARLPGTASMTLEITLRGTDDTVLLGLGHAFSAASKIPALAVTDLGEYHATSVLHYQVYFSQPALEVARNGFQTLVVKKRFRNAFAAITEFAFCRQWFTVTSADRGSGAGRPPSNIANAGSLSNLPPGPAR